MVRFICTLALLGAGLSACAISQASARRCQQDHEALAVTHRALEERCALEAFTRAREGGPAQGGSADSVDDARLLEVLKNTGVSYEPIRPGVFGAEVDGFKHLLFARGLSLQLYAGFEANLTTEHINTWNRDKRFSRAYLDPDGTAVIESDLDLGSGWSDGLVVDFVRLFLVSVAAFADHVTTGDGGTSAPSIRL